MKLINLCYRKATFKGIIEDKKPSASKQLPSRTLKKLKAKEPAKCFLPLENTSKVQDPIAKRNVKKSEPDVAPKPTVPIQMFKNYSKKKPTEFKEDIWNENDEENQEWFGVELKRHHLKKTNFIAPKILLEKRNKIKAVETPVVGSSYNPTENEFKELVDKTIERESKIMKKQERYANSLKQVYAKVSKNALKRQKRAEMSQGLPHSQDNEVEEEFQGLAPIPVLNKKKDLRKKRKQKEEKLRQAKAKKTKLELQKLKDLRKLNVLESDVKKQEITVEKKQARREVKKQEAKHQPGRLSRKKYEGDELPLQSDKLPAGNLRKVINSENLLVDRYQSMIKRNILPIAIKRKPRKGRITTIKKNQHKGEL